MADEGTIACVSSPVAPAGMPNGSNGVSGPLYVPWAWRGPPTSHQCGCHVFLVMLPLYWCCSDVGIHPPRMSCLNPGFTPVCIHISFDRPRPLSSSTVGSEMHLLTKRMRASIPRRCMEGCLVALQLQLPRGRQAPLGVWHGVGHCCGASGELSSFQRHC
jgi:hypothetical protein